MRGELISMETLKIMKAIEIENKELQDRIDKALKYMNNYIELEDAPINERIKIEFEEVISILEGERKWRN